MFASASDQFDGSRFGLRTWTILALVAVVVLMILQ